MPLDPHEAQRLYGLTDNELRDYTRGLTDNQLSDIYAALDGIDQAAQARPVIMLDAALWYATTLGWPVFPIEPRGKRPLVLPAVGFRRGFKDATIDPSRIRAAWTAAPTANIGVPTGRQGCGFDVIDVDPPEGFQSLAELKHGECPPNCSDTTFCPAQGEVTGAVALAVTGRRGRHYFMPAQGGGNASNILPNIDLRGEGGYVVVAPSTGEAGDRYSWVTVPTVAQAAQAHLDTPTDAA